MDGSTIRVTEEGECCCAQVQASMINTKKVNGNGLDTKGHLKVPHDDGDNLRRVGDIHNPYTYEVIQEIADFLLSRTSHRPKIGIICGSGMGGLADLLEEAEPFPYEEIPHFPLSTVAGHAGRLVFGKIEGVAVVCMQGRLHHYEGYPLWKCAMPVRVMRLVGCSHLIASNAAGGLNPGFKVGDIMLVKDHVNMMGFSGNGPLQGLNDDRFGPRFPAMTRAYAPELLNVAREVAQEMGVSELVREGVYTALGGPNFETVAELRLLKILGIDAVGMSTVHEVIVARHSGMKVFAFSLITNECVTEYESCNEANHQEVIDVGNQRGPVLQQLVQRMVGHVGKQLLEDEQNGTNGHAKEAVPH